MIHYIVWKWVKKNFTKALVTIGKLLQEWKSNTIIVLVQSNYMMTIIINFWWGFLGWNWKEMNLKSSTEITSFSFSQLLPA